MAADLGSLFLFDLEAKRFFQLTVGVFKCFDSDLVLAIEITIDTAFCKTGSFENISHRSSRIAFSVENWR